MFIHVSTHFALSTFEGFDTSVASVMSCQLASIAKLLATYVALMYRTFLGELFTLILEGRLLASVPMLVDIYSCDEDLNSKHF